jgi:Holliday junction resolvase
LVNCKKTSEIGPIYISRLEIERLAAQAAQTGAEGLICFGFGRTPILALTLDQIPRLKATRLNYKLYPSDGRPLIEILRERG